MKRFYTLILLFFFSSITFADASWRLTEVRKPDQSNELVGHILYTSSIGTEDGESKKKVLSSLRMICSVKGDMTPPVIALYWNGLGDEIPTSVDVRVDRKEIKLSGNWHTEGPLVYRFLHDSQHLTNAMKSGRLVRISWISNKNIKRVTVFDLKGYSSIVDKFNLSCAGK